MRTLQRLTWACALVLAGGAVACGGGSSPTTPTGTTTSTTTTSTVLTRKVEYAGAIATANAKVTGRIEVVATVPTSKTKTLSATTGASPKGDAEVYPCTAKLTLSSGAVINLAGYYDTATDTVVLAGSGWLIVSTPDSFFSSLDGKVTMPDGTFAEAFSYQRSTANVPVLYCGTFKKDGGGGGWFTLTSFDGQIAGVGSDGMGTVALSGTLSAGGTANFTWVPEPGNFGRALGTLTGITMNGLWTLTGIDNEKGNWTAVADSCR